MQAMQAFWRSAGVTAGLVIAILALGSLPAGRIARSRFGASDILPTRPTDSSTSINPAK